MAHSKALRSGSGVEVSYKEWDKNGKLIIQRKMEPGSSDHGNLLKWREFMAKKKS